MDQGPIPEPLKTDVAHRVYEIIISTTDIPREKAMLIAIQTERMIFSANLTHHTQDEHCYVNAGTELCLFCGVSHDPDGECKECQGRGFHAENCPTL